jgi:NADH:ubiquinone oxidoreductase subunit
MKKITYLLLLLVTFAFSWQGYGQYAGTGTFTKITDVADIVDNAYYVIIDETSESFAMSNSHTGSILEKTDVTPSSSTLTNPASSIVWEIKTNGTGKSIFNAATAKYVSYTGSSNNIQVVDAVSSDNQRWAITFVTDEFQFTNIAVPARRLQYNSGSPRFVCYKPSSNQTHIIPLYHNKIYHLGTLYIICAFIQ